MSKRLRIGSSARVLSRRQSKLDTFANADGTTFYLARCPAELQDKKRVSLGWRVRHMTTRAGGLFNENISPLRYAKVQGLPVKIW